MLSRADLSQRAVGDRDLVYESELKWKKVRGRDRTLKKPRKCPHLLERGEIR